MTASTPQDQSWERVLWILFGAQLCTAIGFSTINPFLPLFLGHLKSSSHLGIPTLSGLVYSSQAFTMMLASPIWGALADRYGRKPMVVRAMIGGGVSILFMGFVSTAEQLIALRAIQGLLSGVVSAASALIVSKAPREKIGYCMGILQLGLWSGVAVGPFIGGVIADHWGFRAAFILTALLLSGAGAAVFWGVQENHVPAATRSRGLKSLGNNWRRILSGRGLLPTLTLRFLSSVGRTALLPVLPLFLLVLLTDQSHAAGFTGMVLGVSSAASTLSAVYLGKLGDRVGHLTIALVSAIITAIFFFPQSWATAPWQIMVLYAITGIGIGGLTPSLSALLARYSSPSDAGSVYGLDNSITAAGRTVSPLLAAWIVGTFGIRAVFSFTGAIFVFAALIIGILAGKAGAPPLATKIAAPVEEEISGDTE